MVIFILTNAPLNLRGELTRWLLEVKPGVFVGKCTRTVREKLWERVKDCYTLDGLLVYSTATEQGFSFEFTGDPTRIPVDYDGIWLVETIKTLGVGGM